MYQNRSTIATKNFESLLTRVNFNNDNIISSDFLKIRQTFVTLYENFNRIHSKRSILISQRFWISKTRFAFFWNRNVQMNVNKKHKKLTQKNAFCLVIKSISKSCCSQFIWSSKNSKTFRNKEMICRFNFIRLSTKKFAIINISNKFVWTFRKNRNQSFCFRFKMLKTKKCHNVHNNSNKETRNVAWKVQNFQNRNVKRYQHVWWKNKCANKSFEYFNSKLLFQTLYLNQLFW